MTWTVSETEFNPEQLHHKETVFTIGNGYLGTRGAFEEDYPGAEPATLIHGVFDDVPIVYTELANSPDWLPLHLFIEDERFRLDQGTILSYSRQCDLRRGVLSRDVRWRSPAGHTVDLHWERFASLDDEHVVAIRCQITAVDTPCEVEVQTAINGYPDNMGMRHWAWLDQGFDDGTAWLHTHTRKSEIELGMAMQMTIDGTESPIQVMNVQNCPTLATTLVAQPGQPVTVDKIVTLFTSRDTEQPVQAARNKLAALADYPALLAGQCTAWESVWADCDVIIEGDPTAQLAIRHSLFQILAAVPRNDDKVSVSAKTLSGFGYRGHVFWDTEIFLLPFLTYTQPTLARNLLSYRYNTLPGARRKAKENGYQGAMFAWESAQTGDEVTPRWVPGPQGEEMVRIWCGDIELHITTDIAYALWRYGQATGDEAWMRCYGAEILLDTAVFWGSRAEWNAAKKRYEINDVIGPDEYHEHVDNNAFTNRMIQWHLQQALDTLDWLQQTDAERAAELIEQLDLTPQRLAHWQDVIDKIVIFQDEKSKLFEQFEGFFALNDVNLDEYEPRTKSMQVILGIEGANQHQVLKQADVIMMLYLLRDSYERDTLQANWDYYNPRTDHTYGSSLGPAIHAAVACAMDDSHTAYEHFTRAALVDLENVRGNAGEGIHAASAGGLWQAAVFGFAGVHLTDAGPVAVPRLPPGWKRLKFKMNWRGEWFDIDIHANPKPDQVRGVIFDLDGVLTDTSKLHYKGWKRLADEKGIPFDRQRNEALRGVSRRESLMLLLDGRPATEEQIQEMMARKNRYYQEYIEQVTPSNLQPGALDLLKELYKKGIKIGIGSASKNARSVIDRLGISEYIDAISDGYSVQKHKPAPDLFLHTAAQLGLQSWQCIVVEDAESGVKAARAGGMWTMGLGPKERVGQAHVVFTDLDGVHWQDMLDQLT